MWSGSPVRAGQSLHRRSPAKGKHLGMIGTPVLSHCSKLCPQQPSLVNYKYAIDNGLRSRFGTGIEVEVMFRDKGSGLSLWNRISRSRVGIGTRVEFSNREYKLRSESGRVRVTSSRLRSGFETGVERGFKTGFSLRAKVKVKFLDWGQARVSGPGSGVRVSQSGSESGFGTWLGVGFGKGVGFGFGFRNWDRDWISGTIGLDFGPFAGRAQDENPLFCNSPINRTPHLVDWTASELDRTLYHVRSTGPAAQFNWTCKTSFGTGMKKPGVR
ncbi:hypothetical protein TIFTF001_035098 [Ficus carica]|uniref:Uncharacterized protein n=1 Tax=Ficus carica TaxID=3494 RepID=A0AA88E1R0_FICCA|nr:hypothetical protein TIFTF001_035098 [Ficus carica]